MTDRRATSILLLLAGLALGAAAPSHAASLTLVAHLLGGHTKSDAFAEAQFSYDPDGRKLEYYVNYDGVAPVTVDIHGPASGDAEAPSLLSLPVQESPISGTTRLTSEQADLLLAGKAYIDIHSRAFPNGEIRGRIVKP